MDQIEGPWSPEEDEMLLNLIGKHNLNWRLITESIPGRLAKSCCSRWFSLQRSFTPEEDELLQNLVEKHGCNWSLVSKSIPGKSAMTCCSRWLSLQRSFTPEEDKKLQTLVDTHGRSWALISNSMQGRSGTSCKLRWLSLKLSFTPEEDEKLQNLVGKHGLDWKKISNDLPGRSADTCKLRWLCFPSSLFMPEEEETNEDITINDHNIFIQPPSVSHINRGQMNSYIPDLTLSLALGGVSDQAPSIGDMVRDNRMPTLKSLFPLSGHERPQQELNKIAVLDKQMIYTTATSETRSQNSIYEGNSSHEVGSVVSGHQPPSISDMARGNMSSGGTHSYSRDHSAPSWNALYIRDSSPMMIDSVSVQQFVGSEFGRNDFSEVSSKA